MKEKTVKRQTKKRISPKRKTRQKIRFATSIAIGLTAIAWGWNSHFERGILKHVPPFKMQTLDGAHLSLSDFNQRRAIVFIFLGVHCPISNAYLPELNSLAHDLSNQGMELIGINASNHESIGQMADHAEAYGIHFRLVKDWDARIAKTLGATRTAEAFVVDSQGNVFYQGRIDDRIEFEAKRAAATRTYLKDALARLTYRLPASPARTDAQGCLIDLQAERIEPRSLTYSKDIRPIVEQKCVGCHNPKGMAPFSLTTYDSVKEWAPMIESVLEDRRMPPWHADPRYGTWADNRGLSEADLKKFLSWLGAGLVPGDPNQLVSRTPTALNGWLLGKPDFIVETPKYEIRATGLSYFENDFHKLAVSEDTWIRAVEILPGNAKVVHHVTVYVIPKGTDEPQDWDDWGFFAAQAPGYSTTLFPRGYAKKIPAGATVYIEIHYSPSGKPETDQTKVGFHRAKGSAFKEAHTLGLGSREFTIPAGEPDFRIRKQHRFGSSLTLFGIYPHGHYRAKNFRLTAETPDGGKETLIWVPNYDVAWQNYYKLAQPKRFPAGTVFTCDGTYDNSHRNPRNPNPLIAVNWGPRTEDEMMYCFVDYASDTGRGGPHEKIIGTR